MGNENGVFGEMTILSRPNRNHIIDQLQAHSSECVNLVTNKIASTWDKYQRWIRYVESLLLLFSVIWTIVELQIGMRPEQLWKFNEDLRLENGIALVRLTNIKKCKLYCVQSVVIECAKVHCQTCKFAFSTHACVRWLIAKNTHFHFSYISRCIPRLSCFWI